MPFLSALCLTALTARVLGSQGEGAFAAAEGLARYGRVLVVNDGGGGDARDLQAAVDMAREGDVLLVESGTYAGFELRGKSLVIAAEEGVMLRFHPPLAIEISDLAPHQSVVLRNLRTWPGERAPHLVVRGARGSVLVESLVLEAPAEDVDAALVEDCVAVVLDQCTLTGSDSLRADSHGLNAIRSSVFVHGSEISTGTPFGTGASCVPRPGASGVRIEDGYGFLSSVTARGGSAPQCYGSAVGDGGAGLELVRSVAEAVGTVLVGGQGGNDNFFCGPASAAGPPLLADAASSYTVLPGQPHSTTLFPPVVREGESLRVFLDGPSGESLYLLTAYELGLPLSLPGFVGPWLLSGAVEITSLGMLSSCSIVLADLPPGVEALTLFAQGGFLSPSGGRFLAEPSAAVLLDRAILPLRDDCDGSGTDDVLEIVAGAALDCDDSGVPDGCEVASGAAADCNDDGTPDACQTLAGEIHTFLPPSAGVFFLGGALSIDGDLVIDPTPDRLLVYERQSDGTWPTVPSAEVFAQPLPLSSGFGRSADVRGELVAVGATRAGSGAGAVYLFERLAGAWQQTGLLVPSAPIGAEDFGDSVAITAGGDAIVVGATQAGVVGVPGKPGAAYVFRRAAGTWIEEARLVAPVARNLDRFGSTVAIDGDTIVVGAPWSNGSCSIQGFAHVYERDATGTWQATTTLFEPVPTSGEQLGTGVAVEGSTIVVGALVGPVRVYEKTAGSWQLTDQLAFDRDAAVRSNQFGQDVSLRNGLLAALSKGVLLNGVVGLGSGIHLFARDGSGRFASHASVVAPNFALITSFDFDGAQLVSGRAVELFLFTTPDCDQNGIPDECDLQAGASDKDGDGILDACEAGSSQPTVLRRAARVARTP